MSEPGTLAERFRFWVSSFVAGSAPLYAHLSHRAADELELYRSPFRRVLKPWEREPFRRFLPLRLLAVVHRLVLAGELPELATRYAAAGGGQPVEGAWSLFRAAVMERARELPELLAPRVQDNVPARAPALACAFRLLSREYGMRLRLLEVGAGAGLLAPLGSLRPPRMVPDDVPG